MAHASARSIALAAKALTDGKLAGSTDVAKMAPLADWIVRHPDLFSPKGGAAREKIAKAAASYMAAKKKGRNAWGWCFGTLALSTIPLLILVCLPEIKRPAS